MGGWCPAPRARVLGGFSFASSDLHDFCAHVPRLSIDDLSAPSGRFIARVSAAVITVDRCPGRGAFFPAADTAFASVFPVPFEGGTGSAGAPAAATAVAQHAPSLTSTPQGADSAAITDPAASASSSPGDPRPLLPCCHRGVFPIGRADEQPLPLALRRLLSIIVSSPAGSLVHPPGV